MVSKSGQIFLPFCHNTRGRTDRQTDRRTAFSSLDCVCIPCSAVKTLKPHDNVLENNLEHKLSLYTVHWCRKKTLSVSCGKQLISLHFPLGSYYGFTKVGYRNKLIIIHLMIGVSLVRTAGLGHWKWPLRLRTPSRPRATASGGFRHTGWASFSRGRCTVHWTSSRIFAL